MKNIRKLSFDFFFYLSSSLLAYFWFRNEEWFPSMIGGGGKCQDIYKAYPNWPEKKQAEL